MNTEKQLKQTAGLLPILIIAFGCALRLIGLGGASLTMNEAENALAALRLFNGESYGQLLYTLPTALLFKMFGDSEFAARLVPALSGILLMLIPMILSSRYDRKKMLLLSLMLAADPVLLFWAKRADAVIPSAALFAAAAAFKLCEKPSAALTCLLIALCGGERCLPGLLVLLLCGLFYGFFRKSDPLQMVRMHTDRGTLVKASLICLLFITAFTAFPGGISSFCAGFGNSLRLSPNWTRAGAMAILVSLFIYCGIPLLLFVRNCLRARNVLLLIMWVVGSFLLILWQGVLALPWISGFLWIGAVSSLTDLWERISGRHGFVSLLTAGITAGAYSFFYFRLVELFNQQNGAEPVRIRWNGMDQVLPLTRTGASVILTAASVLILGLIVKILLGFLDSKSVRAGVMTGCMIICGWWMLTNIWNSSGFDRIGDHPAAVHPENTAVPLNGNFTGYIESPLFSLIGETVLKHGDKAADGSRVNFITDDVLLEWQLRNINGLRITENLQSDVSNADLILAPAGLSFGSNGFVGTVIRYKSTAHWEKYSIQDWGKWLLFGGGKNEETAELTLWVKGNMVYSADE